MTLEESGCAIESLEEVKKAMREDIGTGYYDGILDKIGAFIKKATNCTFEECPNGVVPPERARFLADTLNEEIKSAISSNNVEYVSCLTDNRNALADFAGIKERIAEARKRKLTVEESVLLDFIEGKMKKEAGAA